MPGLTSIYQLPVDTLLKETAPLEVRNFEALNELLFPMMNAPSVAESASSTDTPASSTDLPPISSADVSTSSSDLPPISPLQKRSHRHLTLLSSESTRLFQDLNQFRLNTEKVQSLTADMLANIIYQVSLLEAYDEQDKANQKISLPQLQQRQAMLIELLPNLLVVANLMEDLGNDLASIAPKNPTSFRIAHLQAYYDKLKFPQAIAFCVNYIRNVNNQLREYVAYVDEETSVSIKKILGDSHLYLKTTYFTALIQESTKTYLVNYWHNEHRLSSDISSLLANRIRSFLFTKGDQAELDQLKADLETVINKQLSKKSPPTSDAFDIFFDGLLQSTEESFDKESQLKTLQNFVEAMLKARHPVFQAIGLYQPLDYALIALIHMRNISPKTLTFNYFREGYILSDLYFTLVDRFNKPHFSSDTKQILLLLCLLYSDHLPTQAGAIQKDKLIALNNAKSKAWVIFSRYINLMDSFVGNYLLLNIMPGKTKSDTVNKLKLILAIKKEAHGFTSNLALSTEIEKIEAQIDAATPGFFGQFLSGDETSHTKDQQPPKVDLKLIKRMIHQYVTDLGASYGKRAQENVEPYARHILQTMLKATLASINKLADRSCLDAIGQGLNTHLAPSHATTFFEPLELSYQYIPGDVPSSAVTSSSAPSPQSSTRLIVTRKSTKTASQAHGYLPAGSEVKIKTEEMLDEAWILRYQHFTDAQGKSLSHLAIVYGNEALLDSLLAKGHVHELDREGNTLLHLAAYYNQPKLIRLILMRDPTLLNRLNARYQSSLHIACIQGQEESIRTLMAKGAVFHLPDNADKMPIEYLTKTLSGQEIWQRIQLWLHSDPDMTTVKNHIMVTRSKLSRHLDIISPQKSEPSSLLPLLPKATSPSASMPSVVRTEANIFPIIIPESEAVKAQKAQIKAWETSFVQSLENKQAENCKNLIKTIITEYESIKHRDIYQKYYLTMLARVISQLRVNDEQFSEILWHAVSLNHFYAISLLVNHESFADRQMTCAGEEKSQAFIFWLLQDKAYFSLLQTLLAQPNHHLLDCHDSIGLTPLQFAIQHSCDISYIQLLLGHVDINAYGFTAKPSAFSLLEESSAFGLKSSRITEQSFANVSRSAPASSTSTQLAFFNRVSPIVEASQVIAPSGQTPLSLAFTHARWDVVELLLNQKNLDITAKNIDGQTAIHVFLATSPQWIKNNASRFITTLASLWTDITPERAMALVDAKGNNLLHALIICLDSISKEGVGSHTKLLVTKKIHGLSTSEKTFKLLNQQNHDNQTPYQLFETLGLNKDYAELAAELHAMQASVSNLLMG